MTKLGLSVGLPSFCRRLRHCHFKAMPPNIAASLEPMVEQPVAAAPLGAFQSLAIIFTQRSSISAVCGYSSLSIMFLSKVSAINCLASGSIQVVTKVARFRRELPSRASSSRIKLYATAGGISPSGISYLGTAEVRAREA